MKYSVFILLVICGLSKGDLTLTGQHTNGAHNKWGSEVPRPIYVWDHDPTNDASLSQASITVHDLSGVWLYGPTDQEESAKMELNFMSEFWTDSGAALVQGKSSSISLDDFSYVYAGKRSTVTQEESASLSLHWLSWFKPDALCSFKQGKAASLKLNDFSLWGQANGASFQMGDNSVVSFADFCRLWFTSDLTLGPGAKLHFQSNWINMEVHDQLSIGQDATIILGPYVLFHIGSCGGVTCTIGSNSNITMSNSAQLDIESEFSQSDGSSVTIGQSSVLSLSGSTYLQQGSILITGVRASIDTASGSKLTLFPGVKLDVGKSAELQLKAGATMQIIGHGSVTVSELGRLIVAENMLCFISSASLVVPVQTTLTLKKNGAMPSGVTCL